MIINLADKGAKIVIIDRQYLRELNKHLDYKTYYKPLLDTIQPQTQHKLRTINQTLYNKLIIAKKTPSLFEMTQRKSEECS